MAQLACNAFVGLVLWCSVILLVSGSEDNDKLEIAALKATIRELQHSFDARLNGLQDRVEELETQLKVRQPEIEHSSDVTNGDAGDTDTQLLTNHLMNVTNQRGPTNQSGIKKRSQGIRRRGVVETETAFYATHTLHDVQHLGQGQPLIFDDVKTDIGSAFSHTHGVFRAPVDGTYVFHVTICGKDVDKDIDGHYYAGFDVDGVAFGSKLIMTPYEQSSQMVVISLNAGSEVTVKNSRVDDGYIGVGYSSFSGFLLYESYPTDAVVGK